MNFPNSPVQYLPVIILIALLLIIYYLSYEKFDDDESHRDLVVKELAYAEILRNFRKVNDNQMKIKSTIQILEKDVKKIKIALNITESDKSTVISGYVGDVSNVACELPDEPMDSVYTWVNGSDPEFLQQLKEMDLGAKTHADDTKPQRFEDFNQLKYSMRSIEMYAPWIRHIFIVTNGQIPNWLDLGNERVSIVTHKEIFENVQDLPNFNSMAIETHLHKIPGLSEKFIYFNDDMSLAKAVCPSDFWTKEKGYKLYQKGALSESIFAKHCSDECVSEKMSDGVCDIECNTVQCNWDGDDCDGIPPKDGIKDHRPAFYQAIDFVNVLYQRTLTENKRHWLPHVPFIFNREIVQEMQDYYKREFEVTSNHRKRQKNDMQTQFSYVNWVIEAPKSDLVEVDTDKYKSELLGTRGIGYVSYSNDMARNKPAMERLMNDKNLKFLCINDLMEHEKPEANIARAELNRYYELLYPIISSFELS